MGEQGRMMEERERRRGEQGRKKKRGLGGLWRFLFISKPVGQNVAKPIGVFRSHLLKSKNKIELGYSSYPFTSKLLPDFCKITAIIY